MTKPNPAMVGRRLVKVADLEHHPHNANQGDEDAIEASLNRFGQYRSVVVQESTMRVIAGNHVVKVARDRLGWDTIAADIIDVDDATAEAIMIADNQLPKLASTDRVTLADLLDRVAKTPQGLEGTGFQPADIDAMFRKAGGSRPDDDNTDRIARPADTITRPGERWALTGKTTHHTLTVGDSHDPDNWTDPARQPTTALITDPPYGINLDTDFSYHAANEHGKGGKTYRPVEGDDRPYDPTPILELADAREQFWFGGDYYIDHLPAGGSWLVWDKRHHPDMPALDDLHGSHFELIWTAKPHKREILRYLWSGHHGLQGEDTRSRVHPTQKPTALMRRIITISKATSIVDPYAGSGSTLIAAEQLGVNCHAIEADTGYADIIIDRWQQLTNRQADRIREATDG